MVGFQFLQHFNYFMCQLLFVVVCLCAQLYTLSQDGALCVWNSDTKLDDLVLKRKASSTARLERSQWGEEEEEEQGKVIKGIVGGQQAEKSKNVRYRLVTK